MLEDILKKQLQCLEDCLLEGLLLGQHSKITIAPYKLAYTAFSQGPNRLRQGRRTLRIRQDLSREYNLFSAEAHTKFPIVPKPVQALAKSGVHEFALYGNRFLKLFLLQYAAF